MKTTCPICRVEMEPVVRYGDTGIVEGFKCEACDVRVRKNSVDKLPRRSETAGAIADEMRERAEGAEGERDEALGRFVAERKRVEELEGESARWRMAMEKLRHLLAEGDRRVYTEPATDIVTDLLDNAPGGEKLCTHCLGRLVDGQCVNPACERFVVPSEDEADLQIANEAIKSGSFVGGEELEKRLGAMGVDPVSDALAQAREAQFGSGEAKCDWSHHRAIKALTECVSALSDRVTTHDGQRRDDEHRQDEELLRLNGRVGELEGRLISASRHASPRASRLTRALRALGGKATLAEPEDGSACATCGGTGKIQADGTDPYKFRTCPACSEGDA